MGATIPAWRMRRFETIAGRHRSHGRSVLTRVIPDRIAPCRQPEHFGQLRREYFLVERCDRLVS